jgi:hypothetical protein
MNARALHRGVLLLIAILTVFSGAVQMIAPGFVLGVVDAERSPASLHFFGIVGMFMILFGGLLWQALISARAQPAAIFWAGLQKLGASIAVGLGIIRAVFHSPFAWGVAALDLISGVLALAWWLRLRRELRE